MTWKRVATALVLIPVVVGLVLFTPTWVVAIATAAITILALWEYFALGDAIGHRAYRLWTIVCAGLMLYVQLLHTYDFHSSREIHYLSGNAFHRVVRFLVCFGTDGGDVMDEATACRSTTRRRYYIERDAFGGVSTFLRSDASRTGATRA